MEYKKRIADELLHDKLEAMGAVLIEGPKACGKTTIISLNYDKAGRTSLSVEILPIGDLKVAEKSFSEREDTVASLRLDNIISSAFGISRSKAAEAIKKGIVFVNNTECLKIDKDVSEGDKLVLRGRGKAYLTEIGGISRKGRVYVKFRVY